MRDFTDSVPEDDVPLCPLCDQPMVYMEDEVSLAVAHDALFLAHRTCADEAHQAGECS